MKKLISFLIILFSCNIIAFAIPNWQVVVYTNSTITYSIITIDGMPAQVGDLVGAFVGNECRAIGQIVVFNNIAYSSFNIQGSSVENVTFKVWKNSNNSICKVSLTTQTNPGSTIGYPPNYIQISAISNVIPIANAGINQTVNSGSLVSLDGSLSNDTDGDPLTYIWSAPQGLTLSDSTNSQPFFIAPAVSVPTQFILTLKVFDGYNYSNIDTVVITVLSSPSWNPVISQYNMNVIGKIQLSPGIFSLNENDIIGAFVGNECRGVSSPIASLGGVIFLNIGSNFQSGENIYFKIYLASTNEIVNANVTIPFQNAGEVGSIASPFNFTFTSQCTLTVTPSNQNVLSSPSGSVNFVVSSSCLWSAVSNQSWCTVTSSGSGNATLIANYSVNTSTSSRTANITVNVSGLSPVVVTLIQAGIPSINITPSNLNFGSVQVGLNSSSKIYAVSGTNLTSNIIINAPTGFQISLTSGGVYSNTLTLIQNSGNVNTTAIYVKFSPNAIQTYSYNISNTSNGATIQNVVVTGTGICSMPALAGTISGLATVCQGQNSVTYNVPNITNATTYIWTLPTGVNGSSSSSSITVNYGTSSVSGNITVKGNNACGNGSASSKAITVNPIPNANAGSDIVVCSGEAIMLSATGGTSYQWNNGILQNVAFKPEYSSTYIVEVSNQYNCIDSDTVMVTVNRKLIVIKAFLEGLYAGNNAMNSAYNDMGQAQWGNNTADLLTLEIKDANSPYTTIESVDVALQLNGEAKSVINCNHTGLYYIAVKNRNHIETWSAAPVSFAGDSIFYDFTTSANKAYGDNLKYISSGGMQNINQLPVNQNNITELKNFSYNPQRFNILLIPFTELVYKVIVVDKITNKKYQIFINKSDYQK